MSSNAASSAYRFEKRRVEAVVTLAGGASSRGSFFVANGKAPDGSVERVGDLLNDEQGFFPFEVQGGVTVLYNRAHVILVEIFDREPARDPGYAVARSWDVSVTLSNGARVSGSIRVYQPEGHERLSDWTRERETFRYLESDAATYILNAAHIVAVTEVPGS